MVEATIPEMRAAMEQGRITSRGLVMLYLARIGMYEDKLHAVMTVNPHVLEEADERDRERAQGKIRGPLHGIPIALKDNILTHDIVTTGGALAFDGYLPPYDATLVKNLRDAGAVIIAKTGMTELANWVAGSPMPMPGNYNAMGGFGYNPYDPRRDPRDATNDGRPVMQTGGSSSGIGTAANFWAGNVGQRDVGVDPESVIAEHARGGKADRGKNQPVWRNSDHGRSGHRRADGEDGDGCGDNARRFGEP